MIFRNESRTKCTITIIAKQEKKLKNLEVGKLCDSWPEFLVGSPQHSEDPEELVNLRIALRWLALMSKSGALLIITWKRGLLFTISAKMVPIDQMSMGQEYLGEPRSTSGALKFFWYL